MHVVESESALRIREWTVIMILNPGTHAYNRTIRNDVLYVATLLAGKAHDVHTEKQGNA